MGMPREALKFENRSLGDGGEPTLFRAYELLLAEWRRGSRDREVGLHLMFLSWYLLCEPAHFTGHDERAAPASGLTAAFREVHEHFLPGIERDSEAHYVVDLMAHLFPWLLGDAAEMEAHAQRYRALYRELAPAGLDPGVFAGRGAYAEHFATQSQVSGGYLSRRRAAA